MYVYYKYTYIYRSASLLRSPPSLSAIYFEGRGRIIEICTSFHPLRPTVYHETIAQVEACEKQDFI